MRCIGIFYWTTAFGDAAVAAAMLDRLLHRTTVVGNDGRCSSRVRRRYQAANCGTFSTKAPLLQSEWLQNSRRTRSSITTSRPVIEVSASRRLQRLWPRPDGVAQLGQAAGSSRVAASTHTVEPVARTWLIASPSRCENKIPIGQDQNTSHMINYQAPLRISMWSITESVPDPVFDEHRQPAATRDCPHCGEPNTVVALLTTSEAASPQTTESSRYITSPDSSTSAPSGNFAARFWGLISSAIRDEDTPNSAAPLSEALTPMGLQQL
ncbi:hypothetical protein DFR75_10435 [Nocardia ignorata]|uniref:IstB-like ATP-binding domain-containing protein n=1 Tax=Nocardia ignorata TaxID=145285 RepID=A0A4R6PIL1_NOCIG|nr:hypothetical protein DFR75_10435 [Nocardia ignorata]